jgi:hypothetical protein
VPVAASSVKKTFASSVPNRIPLDKIVVQPLSQPQQKDVLVIPDSTPALSPPSSNDSVDELLIMKHARISDGQAPKKNLRKKGSSAQKKQVASTNSVKATSAVSGSPKSAPPVSSPRQAGSNLVSSAVNFVFSALRSPFRGASPKEDVAPIGPQEVGAAPAPRSPLKDKENSPHAESTSVLPAPKSSPPKVVPDKEDLSSTPVIDPTPPVHPMDVPKDDFTPVTRRRAASATAYSSLSTVSTVDVRRQPDNTSGRSSHGSFDLYFPPRLPNKGKGRDEPKQPERRIRPKTKRESPKQPSVPLTTGGCSVRDFFFTFSTYMVFFAVFSFCCSLVLLQIPLFDFVNFFSFGSNFLVELVEFRASMDFLFALFSAVLPILWVIPSLISNVLIVLVKELAQCIVVAIHALPVYLKKKNTFGYCYPRRGG